MPSAVAAVRGPGRRREQPLQVVLTDLKIPGIDGLAVLRHVKESGADTEVVLLTGHGSIDAAIDVRVVAATNQDPYRRVQEHRFREDLYDRLNVVALDLRSLRQRPEDLVPLADRYVRLHARQLGKCIDGFSAAALALMRRRCSAR